MLSSSYALTKVAIRFKIMQHFGDITSMIVIKHYKSCNQVVHCLYNLSILHLVWGAHTIAAYSKISQPHIVHHQPSNNARDIIIQQTVCNIFPVSHN